MAYENYIIKHKDIDVAKIILNKNNYNITEIELNNTIFTPISNNIPKDEQLTDINQWFGNRCIPNSRDGVDRLKQKYNIHNLKELMVLSLGLSLSDHYWIIPENKNNIKWNEVNFFDNKYNENMGKVFFDKKFVKNIGDHIGYVPDSSLNGLLKKRWVNKNNLNLLIKGSSFPLKQEPFNEYFSSMFLDTLNIKHTPYKLLKEGNEYNSICPCIINKNTEMVSFVDMLRKYGQHNTIDKYDGYTRIMNLLQNNPCLSYKDDIKKMVVADYLICNNDRHWNNFGILRDSNTGKWIEAIPLYDHGGSLWNCEDVPQNTISKCSSFADTNEDCIKKLKININNYVKKEQIANMINIFDLSFENYNNKERKQQLRNGLIKKRENIIKYMDNCEYDILQTPSVSQSSGRKR